MESRAYLAVEEPLHRAENLLNLTTTAALNEDHAMDQEQIVEGIHAALDELKKIRETLQEDGEQ